MKFILKAAVTIFLLGLPVQPVLANHINRPSIRAYPDTRASSSASRLPLLTKARDVVVEFLVGRHPTKSTESSLQGSASRNRYANEVVLRFNVTSHDEETALAGAAARLFLDVWAFTDEFVDIRLHRDEVAPLLSLLPESLQFAQSTLISDVEKAVSDSMSSPAMGEAKDEKYLASVQSTIVSGADAGDNLFFQDYQPLQVIVRWMQLLEAMFPTYVEYTTLGKSFEGKEIPALRVGIPNSADSGEARKTILVTGGLHAREWISTSTVNYLAWGFISSFGKERMITKLLAEFDIIFAPALNPDGIEYSWQVDRLWRKSRQQTNLRYCRGLDLDHAFGYGWDGSEAQTDPCSESYGGEQPFQAVEAAELAEWARNQTRNNVKFVGILDLHSYSQQILFPYSFSCEAVPPNLENLEELAAGIAKAIRISNGESYSVTSACEGTAMATAAQKGDQLWNRVESGGGSAIDWFYHELGAHFSYQIKLRDTGSYGFLLPKEYIIPTGEEVFNAMKYFGDYLLGNNGIERFTSKMETDGTTDKFPVDDKMPNSQELRKRRPRR